MDLPDDELRDVVHPGRTGDTVATGVRHKALILVASGLWLLSASSWVAFAVPQLVIRKAMQW